MILNVEELSFLYRNHQVLQNVALEVNHGEIVAILGPNGVGKTTLLKCLNRIIKPKFGKIYLDGDEIRTLGTQEIARRAGYVPQRVETGRLTAFDAVLLGRRPHIGWDIATRDIQIVDAVFTRLSMEHLRLCYIDEMSGGELQKIAIARALVQEPRILLLDEPTSSLDLKNQVDILTTIVGIVREHGIAAVMTMHDLNQALRYADRVIFLKDGKVHFHGTSEVVTTQVIEEVYGLPVMMGTIEGIRFIIPRHHPEEMSKQGILRSLYMCSTESPAVQEQPKYATFEEVAEFHGHVCPGLSSGYQVAIAAMKALGVERPRDEELVAIAETDACGVDAIQVVTGCTAGKGNLIICDYGKHVFTFYCRKSDKAVRVSTNLDEFMPRKPEMEELRPKVFSGQATAEEQNKFHDIMHQVSDAILQAPPEKVVKVEFVEMKPPQKARIFTSIPCGCCGEMVADAKTREYEGKKLCMPCFLKATE